MRSQAELTYFRALELTTELVEGAGASLLPAGHLATPEEILTICRTFHPTVISGDASHIIRLAAHIETVGFTEELGIKKVLFTSEPLTRSQRSCLTSVFGNVEFISIFASAEMGPWAVSNYSVISSPPDDETVDFIFDSRNMVVEVLPMDFKLTPETCNFPCKFEDEGKAGLLAVTLLQRLRHPLIRYLIGDIGSVHTIPEAAKASIKRDTKHLRILRLHGRDTRRSFKWFGECFDFGILHKSMLNTSWGVLKWQVILDKEPTDKIRDTLEVRVLRGTGRSTEPTSMILRDDELLEELKKNFMVDKPSVNMFKVKIVNSEGFVRSRTGNKVIAFVDQRRDYK